MSDMERVLIAYNNEPGGVLRDFMESCSDEAKQICIDNQIDFRSVSSPNLTEQSVIGTMTECALCVISAHGDVYGIYNENNEDVVSTRTTNYVFNGKGLYSVVCLCAQHLLPQLASVGLKFFVGSNKEFTVRGDRLPFITCAMSGLRYFLSGNNAQDSYAKMLQTYDDQIAELDKVNPLAAIDLAHDREALVCFGEGTITFPDLK